MINFVIKYLILLCLSLQLSQTEINHKEDDFRNFFNKFHYYSKKGNTKQITNLISFPFYFGRNKVEKTDFINDTSERLNFMTPSFFMFFQKNRTHISDNLVSYKNKAEFLAVFPQIEAFQDVNENSAVFELEIPNSNGGTAKRYVFAKKESNYKLVLLYTL